MSSPTHLLPTVCLNSIKTQARYISEKQTFVLLCHSARQSRDSEEHNTFDTV